MKKTKVLMVDDEEILLKATALIMSNSAYLFTVESDSTVALKRIMSGEEEIDILLLDLNMPGMSGQDIIKTLKKEGMLDKIKVIAQTGNSIVNIDVDIDIIKKPYSPKDLIKKLDEVSGK